MNLLTFHYYGVFLLSDADFSWIGKMSPHERLPCSSGNLYLCLLADNGVYVSQINMTRANVLLWWSSFSPGSASDLWCLLFVLIVMWLGEGLVKWPISSGQPLCFCWARWTFSDASTARPAVCLCLLVLWCNLEWQKSGFFSTWLHLFNSFSLSSCCCPPSPCVCLCCPAFWLFVSVCVSCIWMCVFAHACVCLCLLRFVFVCGCVSSLG